MKRKSKDEAVDEILLILEQYGIKLEELEPDKAQPRPEETTREIVVSES
jgi:hypothetical protein